MQTYYIIIRNALRQRLMYRASIWLQIISGIFIVLIQGSLWTTLLNSGYEGVQQKEMISFIVVNLLVGSIANFMSTQMIGDRVQDGSIATYMNLPVSFKWMLFGEKMGENIFSLLFKGIPGLIVAVVFYQTALPSSMQHMALFLLSLFLGILLSFHIQYIFNLSAFWIINPWYISFFSNGIMKLFGGQVVPLWFYPASLVAFGMYLPFRFCTFEPIQIYLGYSDIRGAWICIGTQLVWIAILTMLEKLIWHQASRRVFVQGG